MTCMLIFFVVDNFSRTNLALDLLDKLKHLKVLPGRSHSKLIKRAAVDRKDQNYSNPHDMVRFTWSFESFLSLSLRPFSPFFYPQANVLNLPFRCRLPNQAPPSLPLWSFSSSHPSSWSSPLSSWLLQLSSGQNGKGIWKHLCCILARLELKKQEKSKSRCTSWKMITTVSTIILQQIRGKHLSTKSASADTTPRPVIGTLHWSLQGLQRGRLSSISSVNPLRCKNSGSALALFKAYLERGLPSPSLHLFCYFFFHSLKHQQTERYQHLIDQFNNQCVLQCNWVPDSEPQPVVILRNHVAGNSQAKKYNSAADFSISTPCGNHAPVCPFGR